ncbi:hypothetical protein FM037_17575 [Shewanella psychropiezotolerans]|uniref:Uncharacterized protein n=1 Tax=Shewanella psychropiezotolerans TaxID=2593655 RepID=A0ABX5X116_9GAMM|nr:MULTISPECIES: hypothetical protein [Shewanella]MPY21723.1 hypothetical protein [Shewanella sp. YLB-07]QDO84693.1 hypothetical protein FM037_17575 [Shewanella psychropiezotolerans]
MDSQGQRNKRLILKTKVFTLFSYLLVSCTFSSYVFANSDLSSLDELSSQDNSVYSIQTGYEHSILIQQHGTGHRISVAQWGSSQTAVVTQGQASD